MTTITLTPAYPGPEIHLAAGMIESWSRNTSGGTTTVVLVSGRRLTVTDYAEDIAKKINAALKAGA